MNRFSATALVTLVAAGVAAAQNPGPMYGYPSGQPVGKQIAANVLAGIAQGLSGQPTYPTYPQPWAYPQPSVPLLVTPNTATGWNPLTGGINTGNTQVNSSFFDPGREAAKFNGTMRPVDRPLYDPYGNVVGRQAGAEWYNPNTGRMNGQVTNVTPNNSGGVHEQKGFYMTGPAAGRTTRTGGRR